MKWREEVLKVANLANIELSATDVDAFVKSVESVLKWIEQLDDISSASDNVHNQGIYSGCALNLRNDEENDGGDIEAILKNVPSHNYGYITVPKVIE